MHERCLWRRNICLGGESHVGGRWSQARIGECVSVKPIISAPWPRHDEDEVAAVADVLRSGRTNYWSGDQGRCFEREFADFTGVDHAIFVANGTLALEVALRSLGLPPDSEVVTTPRSFVASTGAIVAAGLRPVYADVDPDSGNITPATIGAVLTPDTSAVLVVHLAGWPADLDGIKALCDARGLRLIEDCAQAHGAMVGGAHVGSIGDVAAWSFCHDKAVTTGGEGGMVATNDATLWRRVCSLRDHGKSFEALGTQGERQGYRWVHEDSGSNLRASELQAAIGRLQYRKLNSWRRERTANALALAEFLRRVPGLRVPLPDAGFTHGFYRLYAYVEPSALGTGWSYDRILAELAERGLPAMAGSCPEVYRETAFAQPGISPVDPLPTAAALGTQSLAFRVHPGISRKELQDVAEAVDDVMTRAMNDGRRPGGRAA